MEILFTSKPAHILEDLVGVLAMIHPLATEIDDARGMSRHVTERLREFQLIREKYRLIFINMEPEWMHGEWYYWVAEIGDGYTLKSTNWWLFSLSQLIICK